MSRLPDGTIKWPRPASIGAEELVLPDVIGEAQPGELSAGGVVGALVLLLCSRRGQVGAAQLITESHGCSVDDPLLQLLETLAAAAVESGRTGAIRAILGACRLGACRKMGTYE